MRPINTCFFSLFLFLLVSVWPARAQAEDRAPHGLANQNPVSISPSAYDFFHPNGAHQPASTADDADNEDHLCSSRSSKCSSFSLSSTAAQVRATEVHHPTLPAAAPGSTRVGAGGIAGIVVGLAFALLLAMGAYHVVVTRRSNSHKLNSPDA